MRGAKALEILDKCLRTKDYEIPKNNFNENGTFDLEILEHILLGMKYNPKIGIHRIDLKVILKRPGFRISQRIKNNSKIGKFHKINSFEAQ